MDAAVDCTQRVHRLFVARGGDDCGSHPMAAAFAKLGSIVCVEACEMSAGQFKSGASATWTNQPSPHWWSSAALCRPGLCERQAVATSTRSDEPIAVALAELDSSDASVEAGEDIRLHIRVGKEPPREMFNQIRWNLALDYCGLPAL